MPRLPTILVIGSQAISTSSVSFGAVGASWLSSRVVMVASPGLLVSGKQGVALAAPLRLLVDGTEGDAPQGADDAAVHGADGAGHPGAGRLVHERHELVREPGHRAGDADPAHVRAAADPVDPAALGHVAPHHRPPAAELHQALG